MLFSKFVNIINLETSAFCNRKCSYCPISMIDRKQEYMTDEIFDSIVTQLEDTNFCGRVIMNLYNEPLLDVHLLEKIKKLKERLPNVGIGLNSNGDYLTREKLDSLVDAGVIWLLVTRHAPDGKFDISAEDDVLSFIEKLNVKDCIIEHSELQNSNISYHIKYKSCDFYVCANNWEEKGNSRGGVLKKLNAKEIRTTPCSNPTRELTIDYKGNIKPCCNIYFNENSDYGNVINDGILKVYFENLLDFRKSLFKFGNKTAECALCNTPDNVDESTRELRETII